MTLRYDQPLYRPPSEAESLIFQATLGCSHNGCRFCYMYKDKRFRVRPWPDLRAEIEAAGRMFPAARRVFLADGDAFVLDTSYLERILEYLGRAFADLQRVSIYAGPRSLLDKSVAEMRRLRAGKLTLLYYGVESGDRELLGRVGKGATPGEMAEGCRKAHEAGLKLSITVILGLAGRAGSERHARLTAELLSRISPRYLSALSLILGPHREAYADALGPGFEYNSPLDDVRELRALIEDLGAERCIFRSNHASNHLALAGTLTRDRPALLAAIDGALAEPERLLRPGWLRGL